MRRVIPCCPESWLWLLWQFRCLPTTITGAERRNDGYYGRDDDYRRNRRDDDYRRNRNRNYGYSRNDRYGYGNGYVRCTYGNGAAMETAAIRKETRA